MWASPLEAACPGPCAQESPAHHPPKPVCTTCPFIPYHAGSPVM